MSPATRIPFASPYQGHPAEMTTGRMATDIATGDRSLSLAIPPVVISAGWPW